MAPITPTQQIADSYRAATLKGAWYGPSLAELIAKTTPELATAPPLPNAHSISTLLQHLLLWNERIRLTSADHPMPKWEPEKEWAGQPIPWNELVPRWNKSRDQLEEKIRNLPVEDLPKTVPGRDYPYEFLLRGAVEHVIYHSGQIAMVLSMLGSRSR
ncbi:MAG TPA: DinB family protein [Candidatus Methylomirabilis sp.]|nr:DinB family protein [Candidatus Methylomirabilis sp.]